MSQADAVHEEVLGTRQPRVDADLMVTGKAKYGADIQLPDTLYAKVFRSPVAHANIKSLDVTKAEALEGVKAVVTAEDFPSLDEIKSKTEVDSEVAISMDKMRLMIIAQQKVFWAGHPIAAVAATSPEIAEEALGLIELEFEELPVVETVFDGMKPEAPVLHPDLRTQDQFGGRFGGPSNVTVQIDLERGDVDEAFKECYVIIEGTYSTSKAHMGYIEPKACSANWAPDGKLTVWTSTQGGFGIRSSLATQLNVDDKMIHVIPTEIGGGFGGKMYTQLEPLASLLSRKSGRPVKLVMTRDEVFVGTGPTGGSNSQIKTGCTKDGIFKAMEATFYMDPGFVATVNMPLRAAVCGVAPYNVEHIRIHAYEVVTNKPRVEAYRGPGAPQGSFAVEGQVDKMCKAIGMDPLVFRQKNVIREGDRLPDDEILGPVGMEAILDRIKDHPAWTSKMPEGELVGRGLASGFWPCNNTSSSSGVIRVNEDGSVSAVMGPVDLTATRTAIKQQISHELQLPLDKVSVSFGDTESVPVSDGAGGSRVTRTVGTAMYHAAHQVLDQMTKVAARHFGVDENHVQYSHGEFRVAEDPSTRCSYKDIAVLNAELGNEPIIGEHTVKRMKLAPTYGAHVADVKVDPGTGKVTVLSYTVFQDVGRLVNPTGAEGQMQGGAVQGISWALNEQYYYDNGIMKNPTFLDYRLLTPLDVPMIGTEIIEVPADDGPYGIRGTGEIPLVPPLATIANAIYDAIGVRPDDAPMTSEVVFKLLKARERQQV